MAFGPADPTASGNLVVDRTVYQSSGNDAPAVVSMLGGGQPFLAIASTKARNLPSISAGEVAGYDERL